MTKILVVSQYYPPEAAGVIPEALVAHLLAAGHDVEVLTGTAHYPHGRRIAEGSRSLVAHEHGVAGESVARLLEYCYHGASGPRRALNYMSFVASMLIAGLGKIRRAEAIYVYGSPVTAGLVPALLRKPRTRMVVHVQDLWPESVRDTGFAGGLAGRAIGGAAMLAARVVYGHADQLIAISPGMAEVLRRRPELERVPVTAVLNWADESRDSQRGAPPDDGPLRLTYAGNLGQAQGLDTLIRGCHRFDPAGERVQLTVLGAGAAEKDLRELAASLDVRTVSFGGRVDERMVDSTLASSHASVVALNGSPVFDVTVPGKLQQSMYAGMPVLGILRGDAARLVEASGAGVVADATAESVAAAVERLWAERDALPEMRDRSRAFYEAHMTQSRGLAALEHALVPDGRSPTGSQGVDDA